MQKPLADSLVYRKRATNADARVGTFNPTPAESDSIINTAKTILKAIVNKHSA